MDREEMDSEKMDVTIRRQRNHILNQKEQLVEYRLAIDACCQDLNKRWMDIEHLEDSIEVLDNIIQELRTKNKYLEVQLEKAVMFGGPHIDQPMSKVAELGQLPQDVQTKSWWSRQFKKVVKGMGTFRLRLKSCMGARTPKTPVARLINIKPLNSTISTPSICMPSVSAGMPPVSV